MKHVLLCIAMLVSLVSTAFPAHAAITLNTSVQYKIRNVASGLVLGFDAASQTAGAKVVQSTPAANGGWRSAHGATACI